MAGRWKVVLTFNDTLADKIINSAIDNGVNLIDTTDVYEKWIEWNSCWKSDSIPFGTHLCGHKMWAAYQSTHKWRLPTQSTLVIIGRQPQKNRIGSVGFNPIACPLSEVYFKLEIFELFDRLKEQGKIQNLGVSVEKEEETLKLLNILMWLPYKLFLTFFAKNYPRPFSKKHKKETLE